ncbi:hypothetical protein VCRA2113O120_60143 [Vibrio crassostreae]|uniref:Uncharacterized protein n=1 Tax=Vibrio crassostreae TaxID=246167 RepID=A0A822MPE0_9VIBR|nr:hypothetical protein VCRA2114E123_50147 [Vibrio crassostreae]CAK2160263.1 hypothetical protein VCRA2113O120_60143 [Vibrio crassostreae]CAK2932157.1 hypothetical protein VCRA2119O124_30146 [Vibrio crassostreae]CAK3646024.1 hypothetical protein VCRA2126O133_50147 [Vibrio crassostreae]CDT02733.1 hypothetical protein VCR5J5_1370129 [Vibrio crassostreae]
MVIAFWTYLQIFFKGYAVQDLITGGALGPYSFRNRYLTCTY